MGWRPRQDLLGNFTALNSYWWNIHYQIGISRYPGKIYNDFVQHSFILTLTRLESSLHIWPHWQACKHTFSLIKNRQRNWLTITTSSTYKDRTKPKLLCITASVSPARSETQKKALGLLLPPLAILLRRLDVIGCRSDGRVSRGVWCCEWRDGESEALETSRVEGLDAQFSLLFALLSFTLTKVKIWD